MDIRSTFAKASVLVVGDIMLDRYWWGDVSRISPEAPVPVVHLKRRTSAPGGAANVACNIAGLGAKAMLVGCVGSDPDADEFRSALAAHGTSTEHLVTRTAVPTSVKTRIIAHNQQVVRVDQERAAELEQSCETDICAKVTELMPSADIVVVSDYKKGTLSNEVLRCVFDSARMYSKRVLVDPKGKDFSKYAGATMLTPNRREVAEATQLEESDDSLIETAGRRLIADLGLGAVLITRSEDGMSLFEDGRPEVHLQAETKEIYDVTGAGDTVIATLAVALSSGLSYAQSAAIANVAAGIVVEQIGTSTITIEQIVPVLSAADPSLIAGRAS